MKVLTWLLIIGIAALLSVYPIIEVWFWLLGIVVND